MDGHSAFAFDLYQARRRQDGRLFYFPHSISVALGMACAGARGATAQQMADTLRLGLSQDRLHPGFNALNVGMVEREAGADASGAVHAEARVRSQLRVE